MNQPTIMENLSLEQSSPLLAADSHSATANLGTITPNDTHRPDFDQRSFAASNCGSSVARSDDLQSLCSSRASSRYGSLSAELLFVESVGEQLQEHLMAHSMVKDRKTFMKKTVANSFVGSEAVTIIQDILQAEQDRMLQFEQDDSEKPQPEQDEQPEGASTSKVVTREEAVAKGTQMMTEFQFFKHATNETVNELVDSDTALYVFDHNLPGQVRLVKRKYPTYWDKMRFFEENVELADRRHMFRIFPNCFIARDAVDMLMKAKMVRSRNEAVHMVRKLNQKVHCCQHVCTEHDFKDEYLFFMLVPKRERLPEPFRRVTRKRSKSPRRSLSTDGSIGSRNSKSSKNEERRRRRRTKTMDEPEEPTPKATMTASKEEDDETPATNKPTDDDTQLQMEDLQASAKTGGTMSVSELSLSADFLMAPDELDESEPSSIPTPTPSATKQEATAAPTASPDEGARSSSKREATATPITASPRKTSASSSTIKQQATAAPTASPKKSGDKKKKKAPAPQEVNKKRNQKRADDIRSRLANYKQEQRLLKQQRNSIAV